jgi:chloramphenicol-sensitive protein RarD
MFPPSPARAGLVAGVGAYLSWGLLPLYLHLLSALPPVQIVSFRIMFALGTVGLIVLLFGRAGQVVAALRDRAIVLALATSAALIGVNWLIYIWAVVHAHVLEASLGYFLNPLVNVGLGVIALGERLRPAQWIAVALAAGGAAVMAIAGGAGIAIALALAFSFGLYGLVRKRTAVDALTGLMAETALLAPLAAAYLVACAWAGTLSWGRDGATDWLLAGSGLVTAVPLLLFAVAARRLPLSTLGLLQYLAPTLQFLQAVLVFGEPLQDYHIAAFALIWSGLALFVGEGVVAARVRRPAPPE